MSVEGFLTDVNKYLRDHDDSSASEDDRDRDSVTFVVGGGYDEFATSTTMSLPLIQTTAATTSSYVPMTTTLSTMNAMRNTLTYPTQLVHQGNSVER